MSRAAARFREADIKRALRAAEAVGAKVTVEVTADGTIRLVPVTAPAVTLAPKKKLVF